MHYSEAAVRRFSLKLTLLKISQYSQENTNVKAYFFNKVAVLKACNSISKKFPTQVFSFEYCEIFTIFFIDHLRWLLLHSFIPPFTNGGLESSK